jgi:diguanylate cyclase (GGDEF)-like protein
MPNIDEKNLVTAMVDSVSALPDRTEFYKRLCALIENGDKSQHAFVVMLLDVHGVEDVLVALGPRLRDHMIGVVAERIRSSVAQAGGEVFHVRYDRFAIILPQARLPDAMATGMRLSKALGASTVVHDIPLITTSSFGMARYPNHGTNADDLARAAAIALHHAVRSDEGHAIFDTAWSTEHRERYLLLSDLNSHLTEKSGIKLHYQPKVDLQSGTCTGIEGLVRWQHPQRGLIPPAQFIPYAEGTALIHMLTEEVLTQGLEKLSEWALAGKQYDLSINLSARNLSESGFTDLITDTIRFYGSDPRRLEFEVTESAIMQNPYQSGLALRQLKQLGACIAIDDFGVGQSSLSYLVELPVDTLKIDKSFVVSLEEQPRNQAVIRAAITLAHELGMRVVAEGIETEQDYVRLRDWGCDMGQGYLIGRPMAEPEVTYPEAIKL